ncbi:NTP transferase domain-containing protein [bacterium]|jgi:bifunctional UDP-N-acetylglucosamine pyrophosphorylase/glucosamine-1-phosphate N-acetyltransferase|nr:NTP transferase domain-containing protein [bacterium]
MKTYAIVLAAGKGTRMESVLPKCAVPLFSKPMIEYLIDSLEQSSVDKIIVVVGYKKEVIEKLLKQRVQYVLQEEQLGTGHAVLCAKEAVGEEGRSIIIPGDTPLIDLEIINNLIKTHEDAQNALTLGTIFLDQPGAYGRIVRSETGRFLRIVEAKDAEPEILKIKEINSGLYCVDNKFLFSFLNQVKNNNASGEYYLTDIVEMIANSAQVGTFTIKEAYRLKGINDKETLLEVEKAMQEKINFDLMHRGIKIIDPTSVKIGPDVKVGKGVTIHPNCKITGRTSIGEGATVGPDSELHNVELGANVICAHATLWNCKVKENEIVLPYSCQKLEESEV